MMTLGESVLCLALIPGVVAGLALWFASGHWDLPWWGMIGVGFAGWLLGFFAAAVGGTIIERFTASKRKRR